MMTVVERKIPIKYTLLGAFKQETIRIENTISSNMIDYIFYRVYWAYNKKRGSSGKWSDKFSIEQKKTAEHFVYLNNHKQIYNNEQQFSISCMGALQP